eukprot:4146827-Pleurochrysis_carterae.AAC.1
MAFAAQGSNSLRSSDDKVLASPHAHRGVASNALRRYPGPRYDVAPGVSAAVFDNFSICAS